MLAKEIAKVAVVGIALVWTCGCEVDTHKNGDSKDVKISTPFGGMRVKTNDAVVLEDIGLPAYPGAQMVKKDKDSDHSSADVNMSFGGFQLRVKVASFRTDDPPHKVEVFFRDGLKRFGNVIKCQGNVAIGEPARTSEGLTCDKTKGTHISVEERPGPDKRELRAGSEQHQHIVSIEEDGSGTKFSLVALDLPGTFFAEHGNEDDKQ